MEPLPTAMPSVSSSPRMRSVPHKRFSPERRRIRARTSGGSRGRPVGRPAAPPPKEAPALSVPAQDRLRLHQHEMTTPVGDEAPCQDPEDPVAWPDPRVWVGAQGDREVLPQE
jgi:hypothetical protein